MVASIIVLVLRQRVLFARLCRRMSGICCRRAAVANMGAEMRLIVLAALGASGCVVGRLLAWLKAQCADWNVDQYRAMTSWLVAEAGIAGWVAAYLLMYRVLLLRSVHYDSYRTCLRHIMRWPPVRVAILGLPRDSVVSVIMTTKEQSNTASTCWHTACLYQLRKCEKSLEGNH